MTLRLKATETLRAPAKLNLTLEVLQRRADGLHGIRSVMVPVDLCDRLHVVPAEQTRFSCSDAALSEHNLVERAMHVLGVTGVDVRLDKVIPTGAGMGGGSSDAAAVLLAAQRGIVQARDGVDYLAAARSLGSDVPFFLAETAALVEGTGERVTALGPVPRWSAVVVKPPISVSTASAYERIDASSRPSRARSGSVSLQMSEALQRADFERVLSLLRNDFHDVLAPATPEIAAAVDALHAAGAPHPMLTGSGSCVFALTETAARAEDLATALRVPPEYRVFRCAFWNGAAWRSAA